VKESHGAVRRCREKNLLLHKVCRIVADCFMLQGVLLADGSFFIRLSCPD